MSQPEPLILASQSPRRRALLAASGLEFEVCVSNTDETLHLTSGAPRVVALKTALAKGEAIAEGAPAGRLVLAADTIVIIDGEILNKPADRAEARAMLGRLSGRTHEVVTGMALLRAGGEALVDAVPAKVRFHELSPALINEYVDSGEADDKAGSYGIQGLGARLVAAVDGDLTGVIGLPMKRLREMFIEMTGRDWLAGRSLRADAKAAFAELARLDPACLDGIPG